jgi:hypothetical protein
MICHPVPQRGVGHRHRRGAGCDGRGGVRHAMCSPSAAPSVRTNGAVSAFAGVSADGYQARRRLRRRRVAYGKAVWSWRPDAGVKSAEATPLMTVANKPGRRGARRKPLKPLRAGMPGDSGATVLLVCFLLSTLAHEACGCTVRPAFPTPSFLGERYMHNPGASRRGNAEVYPTVIARSQRVARMRAR